MNCSAAGLLDVPNGSPWAGTRAQEALRQLLDVTSGPAADHHAETPRRSGAPSPIDSHGEARLCQMLQKSIKLFAGRRNIGLFRCDRVEDPGQHRLVHRARGRFIQEPRGGRLFPCRVVTVEAVELDISDQVLAREIAGKRSRLSGRWGFLRGCDPRCRHQAEARIASAKIAIRRARGGNASRADACS